MKKNNNIYMNTISRRLLTIVLGLVNSIIINRYFGPHLKGEYSYILNTINILAIVFNLGISQTYSTFIRKKVEDIKDIFMSIITVQ
ncbi:oligosaccharide flippase family protein, partial [Neobacillus drentensis]|uniref:oligosaccharide flippase family protein n=1 Tax=Neobacillus drentensis TaxID=220684 RepID=UPI00300039D9